MAAKARDSRSGRLWGLEASWRTGHPLVFQKETEGLVPADAGAECTVEYG